MRQSHEQALLGNYDASEVYYASLIAAISKHMKSIGPDNRHIAEQWSRVRAELADELQVHRFNIIINNKKKKNLVINK